MKKIQQNIRYRDRVPVNEYLKELKLPVMASQYKDKAKEAIKRNLSYEEYLGELIQEELIIKREKRIQSRLNKAGFPVMKTIDSFDFNHMPGLNRKEILDFHRGEFIEKKENIIFIGSPGVGKTHLATTIGIEACKLGKKVRFFTAMGLVNLLLEAQKEQRLSKIMRSLLKPELLIVDELGYIPFSQAGSQLLFQLFSDRYQRGSVIITTNLEFSSWTNVFLEKKMTAALLDRLTHQAHVILMNGGSYRFKQRIKLGKAKKSAA